MLEKLSVIVSVFNIVQSGQRITIERVFGMICRMLGNSMETNRYYDIDITILLVRVCVKLYNFLIDMNDGSRKREALRRGMKNYGLRLFHISSKFT